MKKFALVIAIILWSMSLSAKTLVVYFSYTDHVTRIVDDLSTMITCDVARIQPTDKSGGYELNNYAKGMAMLNAIKANPDDIQSYPPIDSVSINWADYDRVVIGTPLWWSQMAAVTQTFLFQNRAVLATKQLYLIVSSQSSGINGVEQDAHRLVPGGNFVTPSLWINNASFDNRGSLIRNWVNQLQLGNTTGIGSVTAQEQGRDNSRIYDLQGRHATLDKSGIYIVNGKKVVHTLR